MHVTQTGTPIGISDILSIGERKGGCNENRAYSTGCLMSNDRVCFRQRFKNKTKNLNFKVEKISGVEIKHAFIKTKKKKRKQKKGLYTVFQF